MFFFSPDFYFTLWHTNNLKVLPLYQNRYKIRKTSDKSIWTSIGYSQLLLKKRWAINPSSGCDSCFCTLLLSAPFLSLPLTLFFFCYHSTACRFMRPSASKVTSFFFPLPLLCAGIFYPLYWINAVPSAHQHLLVGGCLAAGFKNKWTQARATCQQIVVKNGQTLI